MKRNGICKLSRRADPNFGYTDFSKANISYIEGIFPLDLHDEEFYKCWDSLKYPKVEECLEAVNSFLRENNYSGFFDRSNIIGFFEGNMLFGFDQDIENHIFDNCIILKKDMNAEYVNKSNYQELEKMFSSLYFHKGLFKEISNNSKQLQNEDESTIMNTLMYGDSDLLGY